VRKLAHAHVHLDTLCSALLLWTVSSVGARQRDKKKEKSALSGSHELCATHPDTQTLRVVVAALFDSADMTIQFQIFIAICSFSCNILSTFPL